MWNSQENYKQTSGGKKALWCYMCCSSSHTSAMGPSEKKAGGPLVLLNFGECEDSIFFMAKLDVVCHAR